MKVRVNGNSYDVYYRKVDDERVRIYVYREGENPKCIFRLMQFDIILSDDKYVGVDFYSTLSYDLSIALSELTIMRKILIAINNKMKDLDGPCALTKVLSSLKLLKVKPYPK